jgi:hypothetical protein
MIRCSGKTRLRLSGLGSRPTIRCSGKIRLAHNNKTSNLVTARDSQSQQQANTEARADKSIDQPITNSNTTDQPALLGQSALATSATTVPAAAVIEMWGAIVRAVIGAVAVIEVGVAASVAEDAVARFERLQHPVASVAGDAQMSLTPVSAGHATRMR